MERPTQILTTSFLKKRRPGTEVEAFMGPWRPLLPSESADASHIEKWHDGTLIVPARIYGKFGNHNFSDAKSFAADD